MVTIDTVVNGSTRSVELAGHEAAVDVIREQFGLTGSKLVCGGGVCGACTIQLDGEPVASCLLPATSLRNTEVTTIEGIANGHELHPMQKAFLVHDGLQCGYCTPGFIVGAAAFHDRWRAEHGTAEPDRHTIADALAGHLCRCGAYEGIYRAVAAACRGEHDDGETVPARVDGPAKVTGDAVYTADRYPDNTLHAVIVRSTIAAADVGRIDTAAAPFVVDLLASDRRVRFAGQPIAAVAAESLSEARRLADNLPLELGPRPFVIDPDAATADGAPLVYEDREARRHLPNAAEGPLLPARWNGNRRGPNPTPFLGTIAKRRVRKARSTGSDHLVELDFETHAQLHTAFEPHCTVADWSDPDRLVVWTSTQAVEAQQRRLAEHFDLGVDRVEVHSDFIGGGFGAKLSLTVDMIAAAELSRLSRRPVRLVLDRREELTATGNRPGSASSISLLVDDDHDVAALLADVESHAGIAGGNSVAALCMLVYDRSPRLAHDSDIVTNAPPGAPFRGPGGPTYAWALESAVDHLAHQLGRDPIELRQQWDGNARRQGLYRWALALDVWKQRPVTGDQTGRFRRGVGVAAANWVYFVDTKTEVEVRVENGRLVATSACQDMGTGSKTVVAQAVAEVFDVAVHDVDVRLGRAAGGLPHGPTSGGSRTTTSLWPAARQAAEKLRDRIGATISPDHEGASAIGTRCSDSGFGPPRFKVAEASIGRGFPAAVHVSEVEVDTLTGKTRALAVHGGLAVGRPHVPTLARSQCEGSIVQGIGLALYENQILDPHTGLTLTANLEDYRIPQLGDCPEITIHFHEDGWDHVPGGGVGLGEVSTISPAASIGNAIFNATGWRPATIPIRPDRVLEGLA